jgi:hypothetical protein
MGHTYIHIEKKKTVTSGAFFIIFMLSVSRLSSTGVVDQPL